MKKVALATTVIVAVALTAAYAGKKDEEEAIHKRHDEWCAAWNKHDPKLLASFFLDDADVINPFGRAAKGLAQIEKFFEEEHNNFAKGTTYSGTITDIRFLEKDVAVVDVDAEVNGMKDAEGKNLPPLKHHVTWVAKKKDGKWMAFAARPCVYAPPPPAPAAAK